MLRFLAISKGSTVFLIKSHSSRPGLGLFGLRSTRIIRPHLTRPRLGWMCRTVRLRLQNRIEGRDGSSCGCRYFSVEKRNFEMKNLDLIKLVEITSKNFNNEKIDPKLYPKFSTVNENIWKKIAKDYFGYYCYTDALLLYTRFKRNSEGYAKMVEKIMKNNKTIEYSGFQSIHIFFDRDEFSSFKISGLKRKRLLVDFEEVLNERLQANGFNCYFRCNYNWFKKQNKIEHSNFLDWNGLYNCIEPKCQNYIRPKIHNQSEQKIDMQIFYSMNNLHGRIQKNIRICGDEIETLSLVLNSEGVVNFSNRNKFENLNEKKNEIVPQNTLKLEIKFRLSRDMIFDLRASKILCENLGTSSNSDLK
ncbi:hypothetical protein BpHYR1_034521 [Brachionus plicatilis]|uniref:Uncharacterized protein n=1 Tax=Brachionus plicatilis TaxID=10195 RepID=A0A3M7PZT5_BRAPC|nr:hypothetical protein BpHYR1_034521 [Brachionus plicatilis]